MGDISNSPQTLVVDQLLEHPTARDDALFFQMVADLKVIDDQRSYFRSLGVAPLTSFSAVTRVLDGRR